MGGSRRRVSGRRRSRRRGDDLISPDACPRPRSSPAQPVGALRWRRVRVDRRSALRTLVAAWAATRLRLGAQAPRRAGVAADRARSPTARPWCTPAFAERHGARAAPAGRAGGAIWPTPRPSPGWPRPRRRSATARRTVGRLSCSRGSTRRPSTSPGSAPAAAPWPASAPSAPGRSASSPPSRRVPAAPAWCRCRTSRTAASSPPSPRSIPTCSSTWATCTTTTSPGRPGRSSALAGLFRRGLDRVLSQERQALFYRRTPLVYMWDDHDYGPDNADGGSPTRDAARVYYASDFPHYPTAARRPTPTARSRSASTSAGCAS